MFSARLDFSLQTPGSVAISADKQRKVAVRLLESFSERWLVKKRNISRRDARTKVFVYFYGWNDGSFYYPLFGNL